MNKFCSSVVSVMTMVTSPETVKKLEDDLEKDNSPWTQIQKPSQSNQVKRNIGNEGKAKIGVHADGKNVQAVQNPNLVSNKFVVFMSSVEDSAILEEGELHHEKDDEAEVIISNIVSTYSNQQEACEQTDDATRET